MDGGYGSLKQSQPYRPHYDLLGCGLFPTWQILDQVPDDEIHRNTYLWSEISYKRMVQLFFFPMHSTISSIVHPYNSL